jgi:hypothetical protein
MIELATVEFFLNRSELVVVVMWSLSVHDHRTVRSLNGSRRGRPRGTIRPAVWPSSHLLAYLVSLVGGNGGAIDVDFSGKEWLKVVFAGRSTLIASLMIGSLDWVVWRNAEGNEGQY